jgi:hypothetical protein
VLIGLTGYARSGKDTVADFMVEDYEFVKLSFAAPMREALLKLNPMISVGGHYAPLVSAVRISGWELVKELSPDIRPLMQRMGTEVGRKMFGENVWVDLALKEAAKHENVVFADVRFKNEAEAIARAGGIIVRVTKPGVGPANSHVSEHDMDDYPVDYTINNKDDLGKLSAKVNVFVSAMNAWK